jgi:hypothetical protein
MSLTTARKAGADVTRRLLADARAEIVEDLSAVRTRRQGHRPTRRDPTDLLLALLLGAVAVLVYGALALRLAHGEYDSVDNLGFDFDPTRTLASVVGWPPDRQDIKHPFIVLLWPLALPFRAVGLDARQAAGLVMACLGAGTAAMVFALLRACRIGRPEAMALGLLFAVTCTPVFTSIIVDTYAPAAFTITLTWLVARWRLDDPACWRLRRFGVAAAVFGVTITNVMQVAVAEGLVFWRQFGIRAVLGRLIGFGLVAAALVGIIGIAVWPDGLLAALEHPIHAAKEVYWLQTHGAREGIGQLLLTFLGFSFVAPHASVFRLPEGIDMLDFRVLSFGVAGWIALPAWFAFWAVGTVAGFRHPGYRPIAVAMAIAIGCNLILHLHYQFRGSLYIYAGHLHVLVFALGAGLAPWLADAPRARRGAYVACVLALAAFVGANNLAAAAAFVTRFDTVTVHTEPCQPPCVLLGAAP